MKAIFEPSYLKSKASPCDFADFTRNRSRLFGFFHRESLRYETILKKDTFLIVLVEKVSLFFLGLCESTFSEEDFSEDAVRAAKAFGNDVASTSISTYCCELTYNPLFTRASLGDSLSIDRYYSHVYRRDRIDQCIAFCEKEIDKFDLRSINEKWVGVPARAVVYTVENEGECGHAVLLTEDVLGVHQKAVKEYKESIPFSYAFHLFHLDPENHFGISFDDNFKRIFHLQTSDYAKLNAWKRKKTIDPIERVYYQVVPIFVKDKRTDAVRSLKEAILKRAYDGEFSDYERFYYSGSRIKWKSEFLVYSLATKLYGNGVIYQYRPFFLKTEKGQLSLDLYIPKLGVGIEYQGLQHFQPVDYFGGEESFLQVKKRDELKKTLCEQNGIKLVYIFHDEEITKELIQNRVSGSDVRLMP